MPILVTHALGQFWAWPDSVGKALQRGEFWDAHLSPAMDSADPNGWALDLGASTGWFTVYLAKRYRAVLAVEAHPTTFQLLQRTIELHEVRNVVAVQAAAFNRRTQLRMGTEVEMGWSLPSQIDLEDAVCASGVAFRTADDGISGLMVQAVPIDTVVGHAMHVTFIKIDVQGCDLRALKGLSQTIARCRPTIVFEYESISHDWHGDAFDDYLAFFQDFNYRVDQIDPAFQDFLAVPE